MGPTYPVFRRVPEAVAWAAMADLDPIQSCTPPAEALGAVRHAVAQTHTGMEPSADIYNRLLKNRIVFLGSEVNDEVANFLTAQLLYLEGEEIAVPDAHQGRCIHGHLQLLDGGCLPFEHHHVRAAAGDTPENILVCQGRTHDLDIIEVVEPEIEHHERGRILLD